MVRRSRGKMSKRSKLLKSVRLSSSYVGKKFEIGEVVHIDIKAGYSGSPHPRYRGRTGRIVGKSGRAYIVSVRDCGKEKKLVVSPMHLERWAK
ncbi:MAG: 50S ribosomal protein L21e [Candidatus Micrarchaeia archaeon]